MRRDFETATALQNLCDALEHLEVAIEYAIVGHLDDCGSALRLAREERQKVERAIRPQPPAAS